MARDCILILDLTARCVWVNDALISLVGAHGRTELIGKSLATYVAPETPEDNARQSFPDPEGEVPAL